MHPFLGSLPSKDWNIWTMDSIGVNNPFLSTVS
jgi:hypothetical protein